MSCSTVRSHAIKELLLDRYLFSSVHGVFDGVIGFISRMLHLLVFLLRSEIDQKAMLTSEERPDFPKVPRSPPRRWRFGRFSRPEIIMILEARALLFTARFACEPTEPCRLLFLCDHLGLVLAAAKSGANSFVLLSRIRRMYCAAMRRGHVHQNQKFADSRYSDEKHDPNECLLHRLRLCPTSITVHQNHAELTDAASCSITTTRFVFEKHGKHCLNVWQRTKLCLMLGVFPQSRVESPSWLGEVALCSAPVGVHDLKTGDCCLSPLRCMSSVASDSDGFRNPSTTCGSTSESLTATNEGRWWLAL